MMFQVYSDVEELKYWQEIYMVPLIKKNIAHFKNACVFMQPLKYVCSQHLCLCTIIHKIQVETFHRLIKLSLKVGYWG